jgi:hypothetical protein
MFQELFADIAHVAGPVDRLMQPPLSGCDNVAYL